MHSFHDPRLRPSPSAPRAPERLTGDAGELKDLHRLCREGYLYEVEGWIQQGRPLQVAPGTRVPSRHRTSALQIALESGSHSLAFLLLCNGYDPNLEAESPLDLALGERRQDLLDFLLEWGTDPQAVGRTELFETYDSKLFERFRKMDVDLADGHELAYALGEHTSNKPLFGFVKRHRAQYPEYQRELNMALAHHAGEGNEKGVALCLWAGAEPHAQVPSLRWSNLSEEEDDGYGHSAIWEACSRGNVEILKRLGPDPALDDFDDLFRWADSAAVIDVLAAKSLPKDPGLVISWHLGCYYFRSSRGSPLYILERLFESGVRWQHGSKDQIAAVRQSLLKLSKYMFVDAIKLLAKDDYTSPDVLQELARTPAIRRRFQEVGFIPNDKETRRGDYQDRPTRSREVLAKCGITLPKPKVILPRIVRVGRKRPGTREVRLKRTEFFELLWSKPTVELAQDVGLSDRGLAKCCQRLQVPRPGRGDWAKINAGKKVTRPRLPKLDSGEAEEIVTWLPN